MFRKVRLENGQRHIYFCGKKIISYKKKSRSRRPRFSIVGQNNQVWVIENGVRMPMTPANAVAGMDICIRGNNNVVTLELPIVAKKCGITILNDDAVVEIGSTQILENLWIECHSGRGQVCKIGTGTTVYGAYVQLPESSGCIIGRDCMLSNSINIWASDAHAVLDAETGEILNAPTGPIIIGDHVWIAEGVRITKRARIHENSIVSNGAVCYRDYVDGGVVIAGNPGKVVRRGITWNRLSPQMLNDARQSK